MRKNKHESLLDYIPVVVTVITAVIMSEYFKMGFWESFFIALITGLVLLFVIWL